MSETKYDFINVDQRVLERNLRRHKVTKVEHQKFLKKLEDDQEFGEKQTVYEESKESS